MYKKYTFCKRIPHKVDILVLVANIKMNQLFNLTAILF